MDDKLKIAIYSGDVPSTTFIERLIVGLSHMKCDIYLFGFKKKKVTYSNSVSVFAYKNTKIGKMFFLMKYSLLLFLFKSKDKRNLDVILKKQSKNLLLTKVKCYPVLWHKPDVFHVQWAKGLADWVWVKNFGIKLVLSLRGAHINYSPIADATLATMYKENFSKVDAFHAVSKAIGLEAEKYGATKEKTHVVYSGLPLGKIGATVSKNNTDFQIISVGRSHWKKGYTYALDACSLLKDAGLEFHYTIVGGADDIEFAYQVSDLNLTEEVTLLGQLPYAKVQNLMEQSDLLLLPSVEEGVANVVLESMQNKTLVLTTDCGGMSEVIEDGENGFLIPTRNVVSMKEKILSIMSLAPSEKLRIQENAFQYIKENHNDEQMVKAMISLYKEL